MAKPKREKRKFWLIDRSSDTFALFPFETSRYETVEDGEFVAWFGHSRHTVGEDCWDTEQDAEDVRKVMIRERIVALSQRIAVLVGHL